MNNWQLVGKIKLARGLKGELFALIFSKQVDWADKLKQVALGDENTVYSVIRARPHKDGLLLTLEGVSDRTGAEALLGKTLSISSELLVTKKGDTIFLSEILGFEMLTKQGDFLGPIVGFSSNGPQDLLVIDHKGRRCDIPFVPAFVLDINFEKKQIIVDLPEGLLDLPL